MSLTLEELNEERKKRRKYSLLGFTSFFIGWIISIVWWCSPSWIGDYLFIFGIIMLFISIFYFAKAILLEYRRYKRQNLYKTYKKELNKKRKKNGF